MLPGLDPGTASELIAATTNPPGAEISGFGAPVADGPIELKKQVLSDGASSAESRDLRVAGSVTSWACPSG